MRRESVRLLGVGYWDASPYNRGSVDPRLLVDLAWAGEDRAHRVKYLTHAAGWVTIPSRATPPAVSRAAFRMKRWNRVGGRTALGDGRQAASLCRVAWDCPPRSVSRARSCERVPDRGERRRGLQHSCGLDALGELGGLARSLQALDDSRSTARTRCRLPRVRVGSWALRSCRPLCVRFCPS